MKRALPIVIICLLLIGGLIWLAVRPQSDNTDSSSSPTPSSTQPLTTSNDNTTPAQTQPQPPAAPQTVTITYNGSSFSPADVTVKAGGTVVIVNSGKTSVEPSSDPHPAHTDDPELNFGLIRAGASKTVTVNKTGSFGIHNHLKPAQTAHITIQ